MREDPDGFRISDYVGELSLLGLGKPTESHFCPGVVLLQIESFAAKYKGSADEREDIKSAYEKGHGSRNVWHPVNHQAMESLLQPQD